MECDSGERTETGGRNHAIGPPSTAGESCNKGLGAVRLRYADVAWVVWGAVTNLARAQFQIERNEEVNVWQHPLPACIQRRRPLIPTQHTGSLGHTACLLCVASAAPRKKKSVTE